MKKNVIFLVIDSLIYDKIGCTKYGESPSPFLDSLKKKSLWCTNMYSQGPYTEAGNKALVSGDNSLNRGGYMHNLNDCAKIYIEAFKDAGYETYDFILPYYLYCARLLDKIDHQFFTSGFVTDSVTSNRLDYFAEKKKKGTLNKWDYEDIIKQLDPVFECWRNFLDRSYLERYTCIESICKNYNWSKAKRDFETQEKAYYADKKKYADEFLDNHTNHPLLENEKFIFTDYVNEEFIKESVFNKHAAFFRDLKKKQIKAGLKNGVYSKKEVIKSILKTIKGCKIDGYLKYFVFSIVGYKEAKGYTKKEFYQMQPSMRTFTRKVLEEFAKPNNGIPKMFHLHPEELHNRFNYFSYDINDSALIDYEFGLFEKYLSGLDPNYKGQILYDIALRYADDCIRELYEGLEKNGLLDKTVLVITADHGSFYNCVPVRHAFQNTCHTENFHIPTLIYDGSNPQNRVIDSYHTSKDILPTVYELSGVTKPTEIDGISLLDDSNQPNYALTEYVGNGCPNMREKEVDFIIRDKKYMIQYMVNIFEPFESGHFERIYDLENDPYELKDLSFDPNVRNAVGYLLDPMKSRQLEIRNSYFKIYPDYQHDNISRLNN